MMACNAFRACKAYASSNSIFFAMPDLLKKLLSAAFLRLLWGSCLLCIIGFRCNLQTFHLTDSALQPTHKKADQCVGTITTWTIKVPVDRDPIVYSTPDQPSKWRQALTKVGVPLYTKCAIMPDHFWYILPPDDYKGNHCNALPNYWGMYNITPFMRSQRSRCGDTYTFSLALDSNKFQEGEKMGFILVQKDSSTKDLANHFKKVIETFAPCPNQPHRSTDNIDCLTLPGVISSDLLQASYSFDSIEDLNSYATCYCYLKKGNHYCFIPLEMDPVIKIDDITYGRFSNRPLPSIATNESSSQQEATNTASRAIDNAAIVNIEPSPVKSSVTVLPLTPTSLKNNSDLSKKMHNITIQHVILPEVLQHVKTFQMLEKNTMDIISSTKILASNDTIKNIIQPLLNHKIALTLTPALQAIQNLKSALTQKDHAPINLSTIAVIEALNKLEEAVLHEYVEGLYIETLVNHTIEHLDMIYDKLLNSFRSFRIAEDEIDNINRKLKELFTDPKTLQEARKSIRELEDMTFNQRGIACHFRKAISAITDTLTSILPYVTTLSNRLAQIKNKIDLTDLTNLNHRLKLQGIIRIAEGRDKDIQQCIPGIIKDLGLEEEAIAEVAVILDNAKLETSKIEIAQKIEVWVTEALDVAKHFQTALQLNTEAIFKQAETFKALLLKVEPCYDSGYEEEWA